MFCLHERCIFLAPDFSQSDFKISGSCSQIKASLAKRPASSFLSSFLQVDCLFSPNFTMEKFQYQPIKSPDAVRMLELLPGGPSDPIQVTICHRPFSDMGKCKALSYEWGSPMRDVDISCEGKILKVTPNLKAALLRLRGTHTKSNTLNSRLLWIDAVCTIRMTQRSVLNKSN